MTSDRDARTPLERRTEVATVASVPVIAALGVVAALTSPEAVSSESDPTIGGLVAGGVAFVLVTAGPQVLFWLGLRSGTARGLTATATGAAIWAAWFGLVPLAGALVGGWEGLSPVAIATASAAGVLDAFVVVAARRGLRRRRAAEAPAPGPRTPEP